MSRSRSLPNRYNKLVDGIAKREQLLKNGLLSRGNEAVIFTSGESGEDLEVLAEHAESLTLDRSRGFLNSVTVSQPREGDILEALTDPTISSIAFIGDGNFGVFHLCTRRGSDPIYERLTWEKLAKNMTHLKTGTIQERTCSEIKNPHKDVRVSIGSLVVADQTKIQGTVGMTFGNHAGFEIFNNHIGQLYEKPTNTAQELREPQDFRL